MLKIKRLLILLLFFISIPTFGQTSDEFQIVRLKYSGGSDWYNDRSAEINLLKFINERTNIKVKPEYKFVELSSDELFDYPFAFITGHGNIAFTDAEIKNLRNYLYNGGFLYVDDDYGLDKAFRREIKKVFPDNKLVELPHNHKIFNIFYRFENPPKTHKHDNKPPKVFGLFIDKRLVLVYTYESNPSDGWADKEVHNDPENKREEALKFGANIVIWALTER